MLTKIGQFVVGLVLDVANSLVKDVGNTGFIVLVLLGALLLAVVIFVHKFSRRQAAVTWLRKQVESRADRQAFSRDIDLLTSAIREESKGEFRQKLCAGWEKYCETLITPPPTQSPVDNGHEPIRSVVRAGVFLMRKI